MERFLASLTPQQYAELDWSEEYDPPLDDLLMVLTQQMGILISAFVNVNSAKDAKQVTASDFTPKWGEQFSDDDPTDDDMMVARIVQRHEDLRATMNPPADKVYTGPRQRNPRTTTPDASIFAMLTEGD